MVFDSNCKTSCKYRICFSCFLLATVLWKRRTFDRPSWCCPEHCKCSAQSTRRGDSVSGLSIRKRHDVKETQNGTATAATFESFNRKICLLSVGHRRLKLRKLFSTVWLECVQDFRHDFRHGLQGRRLPGRAPMLTFWSSPFIYYTIIFVVYMVIFP
jgi:hypothetical protein